MRPLNNRQILYIVYNILYIYSSSMLAPLLLAVSLPLALSTFGVMLVVATLASLCLPETLRRALPENLSDMERLAEPPTDSKLRAALPYRLPSLSSCLICRPSHERKQQLAFVPTESNDKLSQS